MGELTIIFKTVCKTCGNELKADAYDEPRTGWLVEAQPCPTCMETATDEGYGRGVDEVEAAAEDARE